MTGGELENVVTMMGLNLAIRCMELGVRVPPPDEAIASVSAFLAGEACPHFLEDDPDYEHYWPALRGHHAAVGWKWTEDASKAPAPRLGKGEGT